MKEISTVMYEKKTFIPLYATLCRSFMRVLYAGALCHGLYHFMLYVFGKCFMPGSVRDGLTRTRKRKEKRNHENLCEAA